MYNSKKYYFIPLEEITDQMIEDAIQTSRDTLRKSVRPTDGKIHAVIKFTESKPVPEYMNDYKQYSHEEILKAIQTPEWNLTQPIYELQKKYDFDKIIADFEAGNIIQSFGEAYITIFQILKFKFFIHSKVYLDSEEKWKIFTKGNRFEKANEYTTLELNYFYNLITKDEKKLIDNFRNIRNDVSHSFETQFTFEQLRNSIDEVDKIIRKYLMELEI